MRPVLVALLLAGCGGGCITVKPCDCSQTAPDGRPLPPQDKGRIQTTGGQR